MMTTCRVELMSAEAARKVAERVELPAPLADLNILRLLLHRPRTAKAMSALLLSLLSLDLLGRNSSIELVAAVGTWSMIDLP